MSDIRYQTRPIETIYKDPNRERFSPLVIWENGKRVRLNWISGREEEVLEKSSIFCKKGFIFIKVKETSFITEGKIKYREAILGACAIKWVSEPLPTKIHFVKNLNGYSEILTVEEVQKAYRDFWENEFRRRAI